MLCEPNDELYSKLQCDVMWPNVVQQNVMWRKVAALFWKWFCILAPVPTIFEWKIDAQKNEKFSLCWKIVSISIRPSLLLLLLSLSLSLSRSNTLSVPSMIWQIYSNLFPIDPPVDDDDDEREDGEGGEGLQGETRGAKRCLILIIILDRDVFDRRNAQIGLKWAIIYFVYFRS